MRAWEYKSHKSILPGMGVSRVLVEEVVVRLFKIGIAVPENDAWTSIVDVAICILGKCHGIQGDTGRAALQVNVVGSSKLPQYTEPRVSTDRCKIKVGVAKLNGAYTAHMIDMAETTRSRNVAILMLFAEKIV